MTAAVPKPVLCEALREHEIGNRSPYRLSFAGKGTSGASFGCLQGDLANGPAVVRRTLRGALEAAGLPRRKVEALMASLTRPAAHNPLDPADARLVDDALDAPEGRRLVDEMDDVLLGGLCRELDRCIAAAAASDRAITPEAQILIALWINMSGPPTTLLRWLGGREVMLAEALAPPGPVIDGAEVKRYLEATTYFRANPRNLARLVHTARASEKAAARKTPGETTVSEGTTESRVAP